MKRPENIACPRNPRASQSLGISSRIMAYDLVVEPPLLHPADGEQVLERPEDAVPHAVLALPGPARAVGDGDLDDGPPLDLDERRQEPVHARVELHAA